MLSLDTYNDNLFFQFFDVWQSTEALAGKVREKRRAPLLEIRRRGHTIRERVIEQYCPKDSRNLSNPQQKQIFAWCNELPVVGLNSGRRDLNLIKKVFCYQHLGRTRHLGRGQRRKNNAYGHPGIQVSGCDELRGPGQKLRHMGENVRAQTNKGEVPVRVV